MNQVAKMIGIGFGVAGAFFFGAMITELVFHTFGVEAGLISNLVGGVWAGEFLNSIIWK